MDWITEHIAIGDFIDAGHLPPIIDAVLCLKEGCPCRDRVDVDTLQLPLRDGSGNLHDHIIEGIRFINDFVSNRQHILVHCHAGRSRSVVMVAIYLLVKNGLNQKEALKMIAAKREIYLSDGIDDLFSFDIDSWRAILIQMDKSYDE